MQKTYQAVLIAAAVLASPWAGFAAQAKPAPAAAKAAPAATTTRKPAAATHTAHGVVKSMDTSSLVITEKAGKKSREMQFVLDPSTQKEGNVSVGSPVQVKYHDEAKQHVATDVRATGAKKS